MTDTQWDTIRKIIRGERVTPLPVGFIIDCPWLPNWYGIRILDYFTNDALWLEANLKAIDDFRDVIFLPGFWSEYGMCTEPSAFGARTAFPANEFPHAHPVLRSVDDIDGMSVPDPRTDGLLPFVLNRLKLAQPKIRAAGHQIRFAVARGPLNVGSYLMGSTEFLTALMLQPDKVGTLLKKITAMLKDWIALQRETFPSIEGLLLLDDIIGFLGEPEFKTFGLPYFRELYDPSLPVRFLHNDAPCRVSAPHLADMGVNLYNMGIDIKLTELKALTQDRVALMGNIPPRDVLAAGTPDTVAKAARGLLDSLQDKSRVLFSCAGGMPPGVSTANIAAFVRTIRGE